MADETTTVVHQWRITGSPDGDYPPYSHVYSSDDPRYLGDAAEACARGFLHRVTDRWTDVTFTHRTVTYSAWEDATRDGDIAIQPGAAPEPDATADDLRQGIAVLRMAADNLQEGGYRGAMGDVELAIRLREDRLTELDGGDHG